MKRKYTVLIEKDEEGWLVSEVIELPGCHTQAKTMDRLMERTREAIKAYLETEEEPEVTEEFIGIQQIEVKNHRSQTGGMFMTRTSRV